MNAGNRRGFEVAELFAQGRGLGALGQYPLKSVEGQCQDQIIKACVGFAKTDANLRCLGTKAFERDAEANLAAALANVIPGGVVEIGQGNAGNAHVARRGSLHRLAHHLGRIRN